MKIIYKKYSKVFSILSLSAYLFILGYASLHYHKTNFLIDEAYEVAKQAYSNSGFHQKGVCQLFQFNSNQFAGETDTFSDYKSPEILIKQFTSTPILFTSEINFLPRRGPPSLT